MSCMSFCNFNSKLDGRRYDFFFHLIPAFPFPFQKTWKTSKKKINTKVNKLNLRLLNDCKIPCILAKALLFTTEMLLSKCLIPNLRFQIETADSPCIKIFGPSSRRWAFKIEETVVRKVSLPLGTPPISKGKQRWGNPNTEDLFYDFRSSKRSI